MPYELTETADQVALKAAFQLHGEMLHDDGFYGYSGSLDAFQRLAEECLFLAESDDYEDLTADQIVDQFYVNQAEISEGERQACYWMA